MNNYYCLSLHLNSTANEHIATAHTNLIKSSLADNGSLQEFFIGDHAVIMRSCSFLTKF